MRNGWLQSAQGNIKNVGLYNKQRERIRVEIRVGLYCFHGQITLKA